MDLLFLTFANTILTIFSMHWTPCFSEQMGVGFFPSLLMSQIAIFCAVYTVLALVHIALPRISEDLSCGWLFISTKGSVRHPLALAFCVARSGDALLALPLRLQLCEFLDCFDFGIDNLLFNDDRSERPYIRL